MVFKVIFKNMDNIILWDPFYTTHHASSFEYLQFTFGAKNMEKRKENSISLLVQGKIYTLWRAQHYFIWVTVTQYRACDDENILNLNYLFWIRNAHALSQVQT